jgi:phenylalanyl-tRNA synthetase beta chain
MKYSYTWLKELSGTKKMPKELAELLSTRAFELETMEKEGNETQLEFDILPNRGHDALSHIGLAREICAIEGRKFFQKFSVGRFNFGELKVQIKDKRCCLRYIGAAIRNLKVSSSPKWMQARLLVSGIKPVNNIVDITNYVMLETGQPLHAFDAAKITGNIIVRKANKKEKLKLLDGKEYELNESDLVIADAKKALALAGVMGGFDSAVTNKTSSVILEAANFNSTNIRKTRMAHNIITESSYRFERNIDPNLAQIGITRTLELIKAICGKNINLAATADVYPKRIKPWQIKLNSVYVNSLLGEKIPVTKMKKILENLGIGVKTSGILLSCEIPTRRIDLKAQEDLIEEIGRIYGYENIKEQAPVIEVKAPPRNLKRDFENNLRDILIGLGFAEVMNYAFYSKEDIEKCNLSGEGHIEVANPLSSDQQYLRSSLIPNTLKNARLNLKNFPKFQIFEIGKKFYKENKVSKEVDSLTGVLVDSAAKDNLFFEMKGELKMVLDKLNYKNTKYQKLNAEYKYWHQSRVAEILADGKKIGIIGEINPQILNNYGIKKRVAAFSLKLSELLEINLPEKQYHSISKFPIVERDISMFVEKNTKYNEIVKKINEAGKNRVKDVELFDIFEKEGEKSLALRLKIGSDSKTLTSSEIEKVMNKIIYILEKQLKLKIRK